MHGRKRLRYFDAGSFTPPSQATVKAIFSVLKNQQQSLASNPLSSHASGRNAKKFIAEAKRRVGRAQETKPENVLFTSGATEANYIAIRSIVFRNLNEGKSLADMHVVLGGDEHVSVYNAVDHFKNFGLRCTVLKPRTPKERLAQKIQEAIRPDTVGVSVQYANSETGQLFPVPQMAATARKANPAIMFHTDAAQATAYLHCSPASLQADMVTLSSGKTFGPQGMGALLFSDTSSIPGMAGPSSHDTDAPGKNLRPGTPSTALVAGFGVAMQESAEKRKRRVKKLVRQKVSFIKTLHQRLPGAQIFGIDRDLASITRKDVGSPKFVPHLTQFFLPDTNHPYLLTLLEKDGYILSSTSACSLTARDFIRVGMFPGTKKSEIFGLVSSIEQNAPLAKGS